MHDAQEHPVTLYEHYAHKKLIEDEQLSPKLHKQPFKLNCFITLTYDQAHLPEGNSLSLRDWQLFAKKLRKKLGPFRYFHVGEYGDKNGRAHDHAILFGIDFSHDRILKNEENGKRYYTSETLNSTWGNGDTEVTECTYQSAGYIARYCLKKQTGKQGGYAHYQGRKPEYASMSSNPGLGKYWFDKYSEQTYKRDSVYIDNHAMQPPSAYDRYLKQIDPELLDQVKAERKIKAEKHTDNQTEERLLVRERLKKHTIENFTRDFRPEKEGNIPGGKIISGKIKKEQISQNKNSG